ncbi:cupin domain-containing protein [Teredinibacter haidensis]|uniref:cupin domain-containing protein n=1 Tax=Teredinibacter haidensis TaxID=2731755 RepID=UPI000B15EB13|nr:cupin domain-containing protein [Teredinibacter haidensis]
MARWALEPLNVDQLGNTVDLNSRYRVLVMGNIFESIPDDIRDEVFSDLAFGEHVKIERIVSKGHASPNVGWYDQSENEWVIVLEGEAMLSFENDSDVHLVPGGYVNIPAHKKHKVTWTKPDTRTIWLAVHY